MWDRIAVCWLIAALVFCGSGCDQPVKASREWTPADHGQAKIVDPTRVPEAAQDSSGTQSNAARALWNVSCASCHGRDGDGRGPSTPPGARMPDLRLSDWHRERSDAQIADVIRQGRGLMPPFGKQISEDGIAALVEHVRSMKAAAP